MSQTARPAAPGVPSVPISMAFGFGMVPAGSSAARRVGRPSPTATGAAREPAAGDFRTSGAAALASIGQSARNVTQAVAAAAAQQQPMESGGYSTLSSRARDVIEAHKLSRAQQLPPLHHESG